MVAMSTITETEEKDRTYEHDDNDHPQETLVGYAIDFHISTPDVKSADSVDPSRYKGISNVCSKSSGLTVEAKLVSR